MSLVLESVAGGKVTPIECILFLPRRRHRLISWSFIEVTISAIQDPVLVLQNESSHFGSGLKDHSRHTGRRIDSEVWIKVEANSEIVKAIFHASKMGSHNAKLWVHCHQMISSLEQRILRRSVRVPGHVPLRMLLVVFSIGNGRIL